MPKNISWHQKTLVFILSPVSIISAWLHPKYSRTAKWIIAALLIILTATLLTISGCEQQQPDIKAPNKKAKEKRIKTTKITKTKETIPYQSIEKNDSNLDVGTKKVTRQGKNGKKEVTYRVTYINGSETNREKIKEVVLVRPVDKITLTGTKQAQKPQEEESGNFVGNKNSKKLHNLEHGSCQNYVNMMNEENKVFFNSEQEGIDQGYESCKKCY